MKFTVSEVAANRDAYRKVLRLVTVPTEHIIINTAADPDANIIILEFDTEVPAERVK